MGAGAKLDDVYSWVEDWLEIPMVLLSVLSLLLLAAELLFVLTPAESRVLLIAQWIIWGVFVIHFVTTFSLAPSKQRYLRRNWIVIVSLILPFFRVLAVFRAFRAVRVLKTARLVTLTNRAIRQLGLVLQARRILFVFFSSLVVIFVSAAGIYFLERNAPGSEITTFAVALWFATRSVMNADVPIAPVTGEGRFLGVLISLYGFAIFGVVTAALASWFVEADRKAATRRRRAESKASRRITDQIQSDLASQPANAEDLQQLLDRIIALLEERQRMDEAEENT